ncbi:MAG: hypothetical protein IH621_05825 [Krumholzibacteria bacterium]|nr:hypothetical protein [Candidatus Krumholzibacteria bacterium]
MSNPSEWVNAISNAAIAIAAVVAVVVARRELSAWKLERDNDARDREAREMIQKGHLLEEKLGRLRFLTAGLRENAAFDEDHANMLLERLERHGEEAWAQCREAASNLSLTMVVARQFWEYTIENISFDEQFAHFAFKFAYLKRVLEEGGRTGACSTRSKGEWMPTAAEIAEGLEELILLVRDLKRHMAKHIYGAKPSSQAESNGFEYQSKVMHYRFEERPRFWAEEWHKIRYQNSRLYRVWTRMRRRSA